MKLGTLLTYALKVIFGYRAIADFPYAGNDSLLFKMAAVG